MDRSESLRNQAARHRASHQSSRIRALEEQRNQQIVSLGFDADIGLERLISPDGSISYAAPNSNGAIGTGDTLLAHVGQGLIHIDNPPTVPTPRQSSYPSRPKDKYPFKILFSVGDEFYIGGDRLTPLKLSLYPFYNSQDVYLNNTGKKVSDFLATITHFVSDSDSGTLTYYGDHKGSISATQGAGVYYKGNGLWVSPIERIDIVPESETDTELLEDNQEEAYKIYKNTTTYSFQVDHPVLTGGGSGVESQTAKDYINVEYGIPVKDLEYSSQGEFNANNISYSLYLNTHSSKSGTASYKFSSSGSFTFDAGGSGESSKETLEIGSTFLSPFDYRSGTDSLMGTYHKEYNVYTTITESSTTGTSTTKLIEILRHHNTILAGKNNTTFVSLHTYLEIETTDIQNYNKIPDTGEI